MAVPPRSRRRAAARRRSRRFVVGHRIAALELAQQLLDARATLDRSVVQEVQQVLTDTIDPSNKMQVKKVDAKTMKAFVNIDFTTRKPTDK